MCRGNAAAEPDGMVEAQARARLQESPQFADCAISCQFRDGTLTLWGRVPRYSLKQAARSLIQRVPGVRAVDNQIDVIPLPVSEGPSHDRRAAPRIDRLRTE